MRPVATPFKESNSDVTLDALIKIAVILDMFTTMTVTMCNAV